MATKFTPGPWNASKFGFQVLTGDSWSVICKLDGPASWEDGRGSYEQKYEWQNQEANARLIAAAPTMAEALDGCQKALALLLDAEAVKAGVSNMTVWAQCTEAEAKARSALRAARGEQGEG